MKISIKQVIFTCIGIFTSIMSCTANAEINSKPEAGIAWKNSRIMVVVTTDSWQATQGTLRLFNKQSETAEWVAANDSIKVVVGKNGLGWGQGMHTGTDQLTPRKQEGDGRAPAGVFKLSGEFGYASTPLSKLPYLQATTDMKCVDDGASAFYNLIVNQASVRPDWKSAEDMHRKDDLYKHGIIVDSNPQQSTVAGSCIFLHIWKNQSHPTAGCTAMTSDDIKWLLAQLNSELNPVLVQLPASEYRVRQTAWQLPLI